MNKSLINPFNTNYPNNIYKPIPTHLDNDNVHVQQPEKKYKTMKNLSEKVTVESINSDQALSNNALPENVPPQSLQERVTENHLDVVKSLLRNFRFGNYVNFIVKPKQNADEICEHLECILKLLKDIDITKDNDSLKEHKLKLWQYTSQLNSVQATLNANICLL